MSQGAAEKGHEARDVDITAAGRGVWLVKVSLIQTMMMTVPKNSMMLMAQGMG